MTSLPIYRHHCRLAHNCRLAVIYLHAKFGGDWSPRLDSKPHSVFSEVYDITSCLPTSFRLAHDCKPAIIYFHAKFDGDRFSPLDSRPDFVFHFLFGDVYLQTKLCVDWPNGLDVNSGTDKPTNTHIHKQT